MMITVHQKLLLELINLQLLLLQVAQQVYQRKIKLLKKCRFDIITLFFSNFNLTVEEKKENLE